MRARRFGPELLFVGREAELSYLREWGERGGSPLIVVGPASIGKTSLVVTYAYMTRADYDKQFILEGSMFESPNSVLPFIASQLGLDQPSKQEQYPFREPDPTGLLPELATGRFSGQRILVVLDGLDEFPSPPSEVAALIELLSKDESDTRWLLTSRSISLYEPYLKVGGIQLLYLGGLNDAEVVELSERLLGPASYEFVNKLFSNVAIHRLAGNPFFLDLISKSFSINADLDRAMSSIVPQITEGYTNLLLVLTRDRLTAVPVIQLPSHQVITRTSKIISAAPYVVIPRLRLLWVKGLEDFEELLNDPSKKERDYQLFFERNSHFLKGIQYERVVPQPILEMGEEGKSLRPDFFLQPLESRYADILDLKLPTEKLVVGSKSRMRFSASVYEAIAQVREYRDYFEDPRRQKMVEEKYGLTAYRPSVAVIIGRNPKNLEEEKLKQISDSVPSYAKIITYDRLFSEMKRLVDIYGV